MSRLTNKQDAFAQHYALHGSPIEAYRAAGYSKAMSANSAAVEAQKLLKNGKVASRIADLSARIRKWAEDAFDISAERLLRQYAAIALADMGQFADWKDGTVTVKDSNDLTVQQRQLITKVKQTRGNGGAIEIELADRMKALDALARHVGLFELDNAQGAQPIQIILSPDDAAL